MSTKAASAVKPATMLPVKRTTTGLRDILFDEIDGIRNGTSNPTRLNAVARAASGVVDIVLMELEVAKFARAQNAAGAPAFSAVLPQPIDLGSQ